VGGFWKKSEAEISSYWAFRHAEFLQEIAMILEHVAVGPMKNFSYVIGCEKTNEGAIIDTGWDIDDLLFVARKYGLRITTIIQTHSHYDHIQKLREAVEKTNATVLIHHDEPFAIEKITKHFRKIKDNDTVILGTLKLKFLHTPGHTPGSMCILVEGKLFTGDTLFVEGCGRVDLPGSDPEKMWHSLERLKQLPDDTEVYPGHDYGSMKHSTIGHEKKHNRFLRSSTKDEFYNFRL
jgi:glyoxylase-like metal-dependent hydrolase (beta-lactamase superfamily II)